MYSGTNPVTFVWLGIGIFVIFGLITGARLLKKADESPWKILIPFYGVYCLYKIAHAEGLFWASLVTGIAYSIIINIVMSAFPGSHDYGSSSYYMRLSSTITALGAISFILEYTFYVLYTAKLANVFGRGTAFTVGLAILYPIFAMILAFGSAEYEAATYQGLDAIADTREKWICPTCQYENPAPRITCANCGHTKDA